MTSVTLSRSSHGYLCKRDTSEVDFARVNAHLGRLRHKYASNLATFKALQGEQHPWCKPDGKGKLPGSADKGHTLISRILHSLRKRRGDPGSTTGATAKAVAGGTGTVDLTDETELLWHGAITLGGQKVEVDFDTGSSDIILNQGSYTPGTTANKTGKTFSTGYGDGTTAKGSVYLDTLEIGGLKAEGAAIGLADNKFLDASEKDSGIAGMSFPALAELRQPPFFDVLINANVLKEPVFTFTLRNNQPSLFLGGIPDGLGTPTYVDVDSSQGFWGTTGSINGASTNGIQDTGTTLIVAPTSYAQTLFKSLNLPTFQQDGSLYATFDPNAPPTITLKFGDFQQALAPETLSFGTTNDGKSVLSIVGSEIGIDAVIFGDSWLRNVVAIFSRADPPKIGFLPQ